MRFAYADPPYLGMGKMYADRHPDALKWDDPNAHRELIEMLCSNYPDGWAMSATSSSLRVLLPMCPTNCRVLAWCKPWAAFKDKNVAYAWEPVILRGGRKRRKDQPTERDYFVGSDPPKKNRPENFVPGMKPRAFSRWLFAVLNAQKDDTLDDLFPGSGAVTAAWREWISDSTGHEEMPLFAA